MRKSNSCRGLQVARAKDARWRILLKEIQKLTGIHLNTQLTISRIQNLQADSKQLAA